MKRHGIDLGEQIPQNLKRFFQVSRADSRWFFFFVDSETTNCRDVYDHRHVEVEERNGNGDTRVFFPLFFFLLLQQRLLFSF
jgi:hypothetical protein